jgi:hypothetical protein
MVSRVMLYLNGEWKPIRFSHGVKCWADGTISYPEELRDCSIILATGVRPQKRPLLVMSNEHPPESVKQSVERLHEKAVEQPREYVRKRWSEPPRKRAQGRLFWAVVKLIEIGFGLGCVIHGMMVLAMQ